MSRWTPGTPYVVFPGIPVTVQNLKYSRTPWRVLVHGEEIEFANFDTKRDAMKWANLILSFPWSIPQKEWSPDTYRAFWERVHETPGYKSYRTTVAHSAAVHGYQDPFAAPPPPAQTRSLPVDPLHSAVQPHSSMRDFLDVDEPASLTYQVHRADRIKAFGGATPEEHRLSQRLMVSDLGIRPTTVDVREFLPPDVRSVQIVDAHQGYVEAEQALLRAGFGQARSWYYDVLGIPEFFRDAEGRVVHRWIRLFRHVPRPSGRGYDLVPWDGDTSGISNRSWQALQSFIVRKRRDAREERESP